MLTVQLKKHCIMKEKNLKKTLNLNELKLILIYKNIKLIYKTMKSIYLAIFIIVFIMILISNYYLLNMPSNNLNKKNKLFYSINEIEPKLNSINKIKKKILEETIQVYKNNLSTGWAEWPEKELYPKAESDGWTIFPFYAFGIWVHSNCTQCPVITNFIKSIPGLKLATLSRLRGGTKLEEHEGWASHSNYVIRCHYGLIVPDNQCYIYVRDNANNKEKKKYHSKFEWVVFDDSKIHYAHNQSNEDRIVLILDIARPSDIEVGKSDIGDSKELIDIIDYFKQKNITKIFD